MQHSRSMSAEDLKVNLLGRPALTALHLAVRVDCTTEGTSEIHKRLTTIFQGLGWRRGVWKPAETWCEPHSLIATRHLPLPLHLKVQIEMELLESYPKWKDRHHGVQEWWRFWRWGTWFANLKPLNESVVKEVHPLPKVDHTSQLAGARIFGCQQ